MSLPRPLAYGLPAALLVASAALALPERRGAENILMGWGVILEDASYALYLLHLFVIRALRELLTRTAIGGLIGPRGFVMLSIPCAAAASLVVNRIFRRPIRRASAPSAETATPESSARHDPKKNIT
jgi:peptidoglycan/LPS O-acetylase OafA/YrhL